MIALSILGLNLALQLKGGPVHVQHWLEKAKMALGHVGLQMLQRTWN